MSVALDATALIYALDNTARRVEEQESCSKVYQFVHFLKMVQKDEIIIPTPAFSEFLAFYSDMEIDTKQIASLIERSFVLVEFDAKAAFEAAKLWRDTGGRDMRKKLKEKFDASKQCVKVDFQIAATAKAYGASTIIAKDPSVLYSAQFLGLTALSPEECEIPKDRAGDKVKTGPSLFDVPDDVDAADS